MTSTTSGYDIVGDIHGHAAELQELLLKLGYQACRRGFRHAERKVVFVGDFIDRGPEIARSIEIARATVDAGDGLAVMGNHEYNAIAFHTPRPYQSDGFFRPHTEKNVRQHRATLDQLSGQQLSDAVTWFKSLPVALEVGGIRVAHAAWQAADIARIGIGFETWGQFTPEFLNESQSAGTELNGAVESVLKGPEVALPNGITIRDKHGQQRSTTRIKWFEDGQGRTYRQHHFGGDDVPDVPIADEVLSSTEVYGPAEPPLFVGHYWLSGSPAPLASNLACTDYSVAKGGKLCAYRWNGEAELTAENFRWVEAIG